MKMKKVFALLLTCGLALPFMAHAGHHGGERCEGMSKRMEQRRRALENQRRRFREGYDLPVDELEQR